MCVYGGQSVVSSITLYIFFRDGDLSLNQLNWAGWPVRPGVHPSACLALGLQEHANMPNFFFPREDCLGEPGWP